MESTIVSLDQASIDAIVQALGPLLDDYMRLMLNEVFLYIQIAAGLILGGLVGVTFWLKLRT
jgi:hypothetical protein